MKAAIVNGKGKITIEDTALPALDDYDCLVKMEACIFCNSTDRYIVDGILPFALPYPSILGHESTGVVVKKGAKVKNFEEADRVLRAYALYPGETIGGIGSSWGGFAEYGKIRDYRAMVDDDIVKRKDIPGHFLYQQKVPASLTYKQAAILISQKEIYSAAKATGDVKGKNILIAGAGVAGFLFGLFLRDRGAHITISARRNEPLQFAVERGAADSVCLSSDIEKLDNNFDGLIEASGSLSFTLELLSKIKPNGNIWCYALHEGISDESGYEQFKTEHKFERISPAEAAVHDEICRLAQNGQMDGSMLITHEFGFDDFDSAWLTVKNRQAMKTMVRFSD